jgi:ribosome maturation protein SDO1
MPSKTVIAKYSANGEEFELFVNSDLAYEYITGKRTDPLSVLEADDIFKDANKGERQSQEKIKKIFGTTDIKAVAEIILKKGNVPVTTEQRAKLLEEKKKQIISIIARNSIDPRTNAPHTVQRIETAMNEAKISVDPFQNANDQVDAIVKKLTIKLPIKFTTITIEVQISPQFANRCYGTLKQYGLKSEKWLGDGSLSVVVSFPAGLQIEFFDKINNLTAGTAITKIVDK